ncbi:hypothetical protein [Gabonibacter chumensis]|uniref:hypothetical protein n=1 Tax=Gabonibacter chumensis TaxID=2972474 RepID=UPI0025747AE7|nr:hypothetical protein [Gabonibacter chumensis]MCR9011455.1 hypothetical protein [Gabonibacter chumensis]
MKKEDESPSNAILHCQKKLQRIRAFIYILILIAIVRIAMMDFNGVSTRICIDVAIMLFIIGLALVCEKKARRKLKQAIRHTEEEEERC